MELKPIFEQDFAHCNDEMILINNWFGKMIEQTSVYFGFPKPELK